MIYVKLHDTESGTILAMCDEKLIGSVIEEGDVYINVRDYSEFYKGSLMSRDDARSMIDLEDIHAANIVGNEAVEVAISGNVIREEHVMSANGIRYANAYRIKA